MLSRPISPGKIKGKQIFFLKIIISNLTFWETDETRLTVHGDQWFTVFNPFFLHTTWIPRPAMMVGGTVWMGWVGDDVSSAAAGGTTPSGGYGSRHQVPRSPHQNKEQYQHSGEYIGECPAPGYDTTGHILGVCLKGT